MPTPAQQDVIAFLSSPVAYGLQGGHVERIDTHISAVFLAGCRAYKMKRAVRFAYLDYSSLERRREACVREVALNRRTAPAVYRATLAVTREADGRLALGGRGEPVEWLVEMTRFDQSRLLDRMAEAGRLTLSIVRDLAASVADFHEAARPRGEYGGSAAMRRVVDGNLLEMAADESGTLNRDVAAGIHQASLEAIARHAPLLDARRFAGLVKQCHGDLHLHNVFLDDGRPTLFDAIEFDDELACTDVLYDFAFLLMDLLHRGLGAHANAAVNTYEERRHDYRGLSLLPLFLSARAAVRSKVSLAEAAVQTARDGQVRLRADAAAYQRLAAALLLEPRPPALVAIGGFSGSGKTTLAAALAPAIGAAPGAVVIRTDVIRKQMFGIDPLHHLPEHAYEPDVSARVYQRALHAADACLRSGHAAILDAVFGDPRHRRRAERLAADAGVPFTGIWLDLPFEVAARRLDARGPDASDATACVLRSQTRQGAGPIGWQRIDAGRIDVEGSVTLENLAAAGSGLRR